MKIYTVAFPPEYDDLAKQIEAISIEKNQTISVTVRDMLCELTNFTPVLDRRIVRRSKYPFKTRSKKV